MTKYPIHIVHLSDKLNNGQVADRAISAAKLGIEFRLTHPIHRDSYKQYLTETFGDVFTDDVIKQIQEAVK